MTSLEKTANQMPAFMVAFVRVENLEAFNNVYLVEAAKLVEKHGGITRAIADNPPAVEGMLPKGRLVILEFPSMEHANAFYNDPEYQPLKKSRMQISESDSTLFERGF